MKDNNEMPKVAKIIDDYQFVMNKGSSDGIVAGHKYLVFRYGDEIKDPDTNETLGTLEVVLGRAEVIHTQDKISTLKSIETKRRIVSPPKTVKRETGRGILSMVHGADETSYDAHYQFDDVEIEAQIGDFLKRI